MLVYAALVAIELGDITDAAADVEFCGGLCDRQALTFFMDLTSLLGGWLAHVRGDRDADAAVEESLGVWRRAGRSLNHTYGLTLLTRIRLERGELDAAREALREGLTRTVEWGQGYLEPELLRLEGELHRLEGDHVAAEDSLQRSVALAEGQGAVWPRDRALASLASLPPRPVPR